MKRKVFLSFLLKNSFILSKIIYFTQFNEKKSLKSFCSPQTAGWKMNLNFSGKFAPLERTQCYNYYS